MLNDKNIQNNQQEGMDVTENSDTVLPSDESTLLPADTPKREIFEAKNTQPWHVVVEKGVIEGKKIKEIAKECYPIMDMDKDKAYNHIKKRVYKLMKGIASGSIGAVKDISTLQKNHAAEYVANSVYANAPKDEEKEKPAEEKYNLPKPGTNSISFNANGDKTLSGFFELFEGEDATPETVMQVCKLDPARWKVQNFTCNVWQGMTSAKDSGENGQMNLWQFKLTVRPASDGIALPDILKDFEELLEKGKPEYSPVLNLPKPKDEKKMLEINLCDLHFAKLSWAPECGENYDYKICKDALNQVIDAECERLKSGEFEKVLFVWTNDFFNADTMNAMTTGGTQQNTDIRWQKMFLKGMQLLIAAIDKLQQYAPVETFYIASNHSRTTEWFGINYLSAWFRDNPRVSVDINCKTRYYYLYGINLIGFSHGSFEKRGNLPPLMSVEVPDLWAKAKYREFHLAHYHSEKVEEKGGIVFRHLPSVTAADAWHYDSGYVGAHKRSYSFTWNKDYGLEAINVVHVKLIDN